MPDIVVVGSINVDLTSYLARWPDVGETIAARNSRIGLGGKGANQAVAAARLGASVALIAAIGSDVFGKNVTRTLRGEGIALVARRHADTQTGMAFIDVGPNGGNIIRLSEGANARLAAADVVRRADTFAGAKVLLLQNEVPIDTSIAAAQAARRQGLRVITDPAPAPVPFWGRDILGAFDIVTPNAHEAQAILGHRPQNLTDAQSAAHALCAHGPDGAIVTMGGLGVGWAIDGAQGYVAAPKVQTVDTVAAGDCFNGAFAASLAAGWTIELAIERAVHAAALATTRPGAAEATPTRSALDTFIASIKPCILATNEA